MAKTIKSRNTPEKYLPDGINYDPDNVEYRFFYAVDETGGNPTIVNESYLSQLANFKLQDIKIWTERAKNQTTSNTFVGSRWSDMDSDFDESLHIMIPQYALPVFMQYLTCQIDNKENVVSYADNGDSDFTNPIRVFYTVGIDDKFSDYYHKNFYADPDGKTRLHFYPNYYSENQYSIDYGNAVAIYAPSKDNGYYFYQSNTQIYGKGTVGVINEHSEKGHIDPNTAIKDINDIIDDNTYYLVESYYIPWKDDDNDGFDDNNGEQIPYEAEGKTTTACHKVSYVVSISGSNLKGTPTKDNNVGGTETQWYVAYVYPDKSAVPSDMEDIYYIGSDNNIYDSSGKVTAFTPQQLVEKGYFLMTDTGGYTLPDYKLDEQLVEKTGEDSKIPHTSDYEFVVQISDTQENGNPSLNNWHGNNGVISLYIESIGLPNSGLFGGHEVLIQLFLIGLCLFAIGSQIYLSYRFQNKKQQQSKINDEEI